MEQTTLAVIREKALGSHKNGRTWHFHVLTPTCELNEKATYAFVVEDVEASKAYVHYSDRAEAELGTELSPLLHGRAMNSASATREDISEEAKAIISRAQALNAKNIAWHHHVLFPGCRYNPQTTMYTLVFEDPITKEKIAATSQTEPGAALAQIEPLFYAQKL